MPVELHRFAFFVPFKNATALARVQVHGIRAAEALA